jgi:hypothetical protein
VFWFSLQFLPDRHISHSKKNSVRYDLNYVLVHVNYPFFLRTALFWVVTQQVLVIPYRRFGITWSVPSSGIKNPFGFLFSVCVVCSVQTAAACAMVW